MFEIKHILLCLCILNSCVFSYNHEILHPSAPLNKIDIINRALVIMMKEYTSTPKDIIIFGSNDKSSIYDALSVLLSPITLLKMPIHGKTVLPRIKSSQQPIIVASFSPDVDHQPFFDSISASFLCKNNCTMFVINELTGSCKDAGLLLRLMMRLPADKGYFICSDYGNVPIILIANQHNHDKQFYWTIFPETSSHTKNAVTKARLYIQDEKFNSTWISWKTKPNVDRKLIIKNSTINMSDSSLHLKEENKTHFRYLENSETLINILNTTRTFYFESLNYQFNISIAKSAEKEFSDMMNNDAVTGVIPPHEKIAEHNRFWIVKPIIFLLIFTIIIVWFLPFSEKNISQITFNFFNLPINFSIFVIRTKLSLKTVFNMIFLCLLTIYIIFSGYPNPFFTIPKSHDYVEFLENLRDSQIQTIYVVAHTHNNLYHEPKLSTKITFVESFRECLNGVYRNSGSVCIGPLVEIQKALVDFKYSNKIYVSKNKVVTIRKYQLYNKQFPLQEKFDWGLMALTKRKVLDRWIDEKRNRLVSTVEKKKTEWKADYRPIQLKDLKFAFIFLIAGHGLATLCFFIETKIGRKYFGCRKVKNINNIVKIKKLLSIKRY